MSAHKVPYALSSESPELTKKSPPRVKKEKSSETKAVCDEGKGLEEQSEFSVEDSISLPEFVHTDNYANAKEPQVSLMKINSIFSYVDPEELLRNNSGVSWRSNDALLQAATREKIPQGS